MEQVINYKWALWCLATCRSLSLRTCLIKIPGEGRREGTEHRTPFCSLPGIDSAQLRGPSELAEGRRAGAGEGQV